MNIDWSKAPEGYPIWIEDLQPEEFADGSGWHRDDGDRYTDKDGLFWRKPAENYYIAHELPALITALHENGDLIAAQATIAQQAQMIEHLRGGPTPLYTAVDMTTAAADGFRDGAASVVVDLEPDDLINESGDYLYIEFVRARIIAAGGSVKP